MKSKVVYVTSDEAKMITLAAEDAEVVTFKKHGPRHPDERTGKDTEHFLHELATALEKDDSRILLVGPAQAKTHLKTHIDREHPQLAKKIVGLETMDKATTPQIISFARKFYTKIDVFEAI